jgi:CheY-like chemotaxis protein
MFNHEPRCGDRRRTIVVIDDAQEILEFYVELLGDAYDVVTSALADGAHELVTQTHPDLLILDVRMRDAADWSVLDAIKLDPQTASIPVLVCSAAVQEVKHRAAELQALSCRVLLKPFNLIDLLAMVQEAVVGPPAPSSHTEASAPIACRVHPC